MRSRRFHVVDSGSTHVAVGTFSAPEAGGLMLERFSFTELVAGAESGPTNEDALADAFRSVAARTRFRAEVAVVISGHVAFTKVVKTRSVGQAQRTKVALFEASQHIPHNLEDVVWDHAVLSDDRVEIEMLIGAAKTETIAALCNQAAGAAVELASISPATTTLLRAFRFNYPEIDQPVLLVSVGARTTDVVLVASGRHYVRSIAFGLNENTTASATTQEYCAELAAASHDAATAKHAIAAVAASVAVDRVRMVGGEAKSVGTRLAIELGKTLAMLKDEPQSAPTAIYLTGGGSLCQNLAEVLSRNLKLPVERCDALRNVQISRESELSGASRAAPYLASLVGTAASLTRRNPPGINLLPVDLRTHRAMRRRQPALLAAAALAIVALLPGIYYHRTVALDVAEANSRLAAELVPLRQLHQQNTEGLQRIQKLQAQLAILEPLVLQKRIWPELLADLDARMQEIGDVWFERLTPVQIVPEPADPGSAEQTKTPSAHLVFTGRLIDRAHPTETVSAASFDRMKRVLDSVANSPFVAAVEDERFDSSEPGILEFGFTIVVRDSTLL